MKNRVIKHIWSLISGMLGGELHLAVPAVNKPTVMPRWRNIGRPVIPYHFMQPVYLVA